MPLKVKVKQAETDSITLSPVGSLDSDTYRILEAEMAGLLTEPIKTLVIDMAEVDFISSFGIGAITKAKRIITDKGGDFAMTNLQPQVSKAFEIMNLLPALNVFENEEELDEYLGKVQRRILEDDDGL